MKRYHLTIFLAFVIILMAGCSKDDQIMQNFEADKGVRIYEGDKRVIFNLSTLPYDMEYKEYILQFLSCELYQEKSDDGNSYIPYVIAKVKIEGIDEETLLLYNKDLYAYGNINNEKNELAHKELSKICEIDNDGYRYYVFSQWLLSSHDYKYDFSESIYDVGFLILQGEDYRALHFIYNGFSDSNVKNLKELDEEAWRAIKQKQLKSSKNNL
ncbi:hypothetical protein [Lacrimispora defluvii]|uniref:Lipoprotein n=1 Tax=Lacrimispora defluvii TaxID=2719233 RepID=A0ABX1VQ78_9FIRM|nr:hypothetical protein [Lacrimispora defluvii]NNJ30135.1 hypothetical protein [Lacrimispora defluvii]